MSEEETRGEARTSAGRAALLVAHPGHELRLHGWIERCKPAVFVLTDGSGHSGRSRLDSTTCVLQRCGATQGSIYGRFTDTELYALMLGGQTSRLCGLAGELAEQLVLLGISTLVGDAVEGYNPSHDLCQYLMRAAARVAEGRTGRPITCYEYPVVGHPAAGPEASAGDGTIRLTLDPAAVQRKLDAAGSYPELKDEVEQALAKHGRASFATESLRESDPREEEARLSQGPPFYESHGQRQVNAGYYTAVIRYQEHFEPLVRALDRLAR
jgi:hypothetical protein